MVRIGYKTFVRSEIGQNDQHQLASQEALLMASVNRSDDSAAEDNYSGNCARRWFPAPCLRAGACAWAWLALCYDSQGVTIQIEGSAEALDIFSGRCAKNYHRWRVSILLSPSPSQPLL